MDGSALGFTEFWQRFSAQGVALLSQDAGVRICKDLGWLSSGDFCHLGTKILLDFSVSRLGREAPVKGITTPAQEKAN